MLLGRIQETKYLENNFSKEENQIIVLYGRENIGKTSLMMDFCKDKSYTYYKARACSEEEQLYLWANEIKEEEPSLEILPEYSSIFHALTAVKSPKKIVVIDEFQNIVKTSNTFMNEVIKVVHNVWNNQPVMVILCSSSIAWVENTMVNKIGSTAYEINGFLKVKELCYSDIQKRFKKYNKEQCVELYSILGGVPGLWRYFNQSISIKENICKTIIRKGTVLHQEAEQYVANELREPSVYHTLLECIGRGHNKLNDLHLDTGYSRAKISVYLKNLMELEIVEKVFSLETAGRDNTKCGLYQIKNRFVYFWFHFIFPHLSKLELMSEESFYDAYILPGFRNFTATSFTDVCTEYLNRMNQEEMLEIKYKQYGSWVGKVGTIDFLSEEVQGIRIAGLCNWERNLMTYEDYEWLLFCVKQAKIKVGYYYLFTIGGFDEKLCLEAKVKGNIHLIDLSML